MTSPTLDGYLLIPTPGSGRSIRPNQSQLWVNDSVANHPYAGVQAGDSLAFNWSGSSGDIRATDPLNETPLNNVSSLLAFGPYIVELPSPYYEYLVRVDEQENLPVTLIYSPNSTILTGGDPANELYALVAFRVFDRTLKRFLAATESGWNESTRTFS